ncbi:MAG: DUF2110 family protein [archaeon]|nr:DUF2110 family protein [archaeon]
MKTIVLLDKFYEYGGKFDEKYLSRALIQLLKDRTKEYNVDFEYIEVVQPYNRPKIAFAGTDENFIYNYLVKEFGTVHKFSEIKEGQIIRGRMRDPAIVNFGVFIDCGIEAPEKDVLLPVHALRRQLVDNKKIPKKKICEAFGFFEEMPIDIKIIKIDSVNHKIDCEIAEETIKMFDSWIEDGFEILFSAGMPRKRIKKAIKKTRHYPDYLTIERIGFLETMVFFKKGTHAPGMLSEIGPLLSNVKFSMLRPSKIRHLKYS